MHARPRLNLFARQLLIDRLEQGWSAPAVAESAGVSRATVYKWKRRYQVEGLAGLADRSSRPHCSPRRLDAAREAQVLELRRRRLGPHRLAALSGLPRSTCYRVLRRHQLHRLDWLDRPTGQRIRRYEMSQPGELGHMDVKKLARIPEGGGHFVHGRRGRPRRDPEKRARLGYDFVHTLIDDHSRLAFSELLRDERASTVGQFVRRALAWFAARGVRFQAVMTDNAWAYRYGRDYQRALAEIGARRVFIPPYSPQINGKVERFNRTLLEEWAYSQPFTSNQQRHRLLEAWLHRYNYHRTHTALGGRSPIERVNNLCGNYSLRGRAGSAQSAGGSARRPQSDRSPERSPSRPRRARRTRRLHPCGEGTCLALGGRLVERREVGRSQVERHDRDVLLEVRDLRRSRDGQHHRRMGQQPCQGNLSRRCAVAPGNLRQDTAGPGELADLERIPGDERHLLQRGHFQHRLGRPVDQAVAILDGDDGRELLRAFHLVRGHVREPDVPDLALGLELDQRADRFLKRYLWIGAVQLVEVDLFHPQPLLPSLTRRPQMRGSAFRHPATGTWTR